MTEAEALERELYEKALKLAELRKAGPATPVRDYVFQTTTGETSLSELFGDRDRLLAIHNMGEGCRYCTLWADGINGILPHLEDAFSVVLFSKDPPETQRRMAMNRGWKFRTASHAGGIYLAEQSVTDDGGNHPGAVIYEKNGDTVVRRGSTNFGPGDLYSPMWHFLSLAGIGASDWTPQYNYWKRPQSLDDGGADIRD